MKKFDRQPVPKRRPGKDGFVYMEMLASLLLLTAGALVATRLFGAIFLIFNTTAAGQNNVSRYESMMHRLRDDAWAASSVTVANPKTAILETSRGKVIWRIEDDGSIVRTSGDGTNAKFESIGTKLIFIRDNAGLAINEVGENVILATRLPSPVLLASGAK